MGDTSIQRYIERQLEPLRREVEALRTRVAVLEQQRQPGLLQRVGFRAPPAREQEAVRDP